jgi:hypothetical protein
MNNLARLLSQEPAAMGSLLASLLPLFVLAGLVHLDAQGIAAIVVAVNAVVGFAVRVSVTPVAVPDSPTPQPQA